MRLCSRQVSFHDGEVITWEKVTTTINNLIIGKLYVDHHGTMKLSSSEGLTAKLNFKAQASPFARLWKKRTLLCGISLRNYVFRNFQEFGRNARDRIAGADKPRRRIENESPEPISHAVGSRLNHPNRSATPSDRDRSAGADSPRRRIEIKAPELIRRAL
eukprot:9183533-Pyramimonas_sp.AAC.1